MVAKEVIARLIDQSRLSPGLSQHDVKDFLIQAKKHKFAAVCIPPTYVKLAKKMMKGSDTKICAVVGFPSGYHNAKVKVLETRMAVADGVDEIDYVIDVGALKSGNHGLIKKEANAIVKAAKGRIVKAIIETSLLSKKEIIAASRLCVQGGVHFVKSSTGFAGDVKASDIRLIKKAVGEKAKIKASAGIRDYKTLMKMLNAGASRIGTSKGTEILRQIR